MQKEGEKYDVKVKINIQTDHTLSPKPHLEAEERHKRKIKMIIRAKMLTEHAIFATDYDVQKNHYELLQLGYHPAVPRRQKQCECVCARLYSNNRNF